MEMLAAAVAAVLVLAPLVVLALRGTRWDPLVLRVSAPDEAAMAADPDLRRTLVERAAVTARRDQAAVGSSPTSPTAQPWAPSRASASSAAAIAASSRSCASP